MLALVGDPLQESSAIAKYGILTAELERRFGTVELVDATLRGPLRWANAARVFHPNMQTWRERFWKNVPAFDARTGRVAKEIRARQPGAVLQLGVLFDGTYCQSTPPLVYVYTDYTARLSALRPEAGRSPFTAAQLEAWLAREGTVYRRAQHVFARSVLVRDSLVDEYGLDRTRVSVVGGGVNFAELPDLGSVDPGHEGPVGLFIGKEFLRKGGDLLLEAFAGVRQSIPEARLRLVTGDDIPTGLPLEGVEVLPPVWDRVRLERLYRGADLLVLPSRLETWGDVLLEAMAFGLPCVGVHGDAMGEIIIDGETGIVVSHAHVGALTAALTRLYADAGLRRIMGRAGRRRVEDQFTWARVVERMGFVIDLPPGDCGAAHSGPSLR